jgi:hypothetical protein
MPITQRNPGDKVIVKLYDDFYPEFLNGKLGTILTPGTLYDYKDHSHYMSPGYFVQVEGYETPFFLFSDECEEA